MVQTQDGIKMQHLAAHPKQTLQLASIDPMVTVKLSICVSLAFAFSISFRFVSFRVLNHVKRPQISDPRGPLIKPLLFFFIRGPPAGCGAICGSAPAGIPRLDFTPQTRRSITGGCLEPGLRRVLRQATPP